MTKKVKVVKKASKPKPKRKMHKRRSLNTLADILPTSRPSSLPAPEPFGTIPIEDAYTMVCPMAMHALVRDTDGTLKQSMYCVGNKCMAWRSLDQVTGFCGLAGEP